MLKTLTAIILLPAAIAKQVKGPCFKVGGEGGGCSHFVERKQVKCWNVPNATIELGQINICRIVTHGSLKMVKSHVVINIP